MLSASYGPTTEQHQVPNLGTSSVGTWVAICSDKHLGHTTDLKSSFVCLFLHFATQMLSNLLFLTLTLSVGFVSMVKEQDGISETGCWWEG